MSAVMISVSQHSSFTELIALQTVIYRVIKRALLQEGLPFQVEQLPVMMYIYKHGFVCQQEIADAVFRDKSSIQRTITKLARMGYLQISQGEDKRKKLLKLSPSGRDIVLRIVKFPFGPEMENPF